MLEIELPYPPSINHYWRRVGSKTLISRQGRRFRATVMAILARLQMNPLAGKLVVEVQVHPPDTQRRDLDNVQKALLDALQHGGAYADDSQIIRLEVTKGEPIAGGKTLVRIREA
jgi:crossover junction endodeoxyribonuclease RusA